MLMAWVGSGCSALKLRAEHFKESVVECVAVTPVCAHVLERTVKIQHLPGTPLRELFRLE